MKYNSFKSKRLRSTNVLQPSKMSRWQKLKVKEKLFNSNNSYLRIVAHNPIIHKVKPITDAYNLQDETLSENFWIWMKNKSIAVVQTVVQPTQLEVIVTNQQHTMTFNNKQVYVCKQVQMDTSKPSLIKILTVSETL